MSDRKLSDIEVHAEFCAKHLAEMPNDLFTTGTLPPAIMLASATLRQLSLRIARVDKDLATERRLHRETEKRAETMKVERDVARRERDKRSSTETRITHSLDLPSDFTLANIQRGPTGGIF